MVKKKKSRAGLDGMRWGGGGGPGAGNGAMGEVTNVPKAVKEGGKDKEEREREKKDGLLKVKTEDGYGSGKWWSIGRGRKDSKEKEKERKENKISHKPVEFIYDPNSHSKSMSFRFSFVLSLDNFLRGRVVFLSCPTFSCLCRVFGSSSSSRTI
ncbi:hypothetical protein GALMADRAFT_255277 [Galerina marginata CBS 339.88]|uniref:Uncharacterized protein n=1 Tax=Galerina marginata (strain CBS 339.88) TaxID=685588 RepID=A0A067SGB7_GALM3|nr:hypothetical protein GALMADRAFT_255277 [Galerina marginata CBS 339.88]